ncbi:unnamed protein product [Protopolystoma xenopodis]|uniref:Uncharacterized protein n=1 Tax=Protopolystoma xenopodis TaxID=117903 RepID=A0A448XRB2_9PLAT|nr:unnamed protein product [Protopolystoma xenopodis]
MSAYHGSGGTECQGPLPTGHLRQPWQHNGPDTIAIAVVRWGGLAQKLMTSKRPYQHCRQAPELIIKSMKALEINNNPLSVRLNKVRLHQSTLCLASLVRVNSVVIGKLAITLPPSQL